MIHEEKRIELHDNGAIIIHGPNNRETVYKGYSMAEALQKESKRRD